MKKILIGLALLSGASASAQIYLDQPYFSDYIRYTGISYNKNEIQTYKVNRVKSLSEYSGSKKQKLSREMSFDAQGDLSSYTTYHHYSNRNHKTVTYYNKMGRTPNTATFNRKGVEMNRSEYNFNSDTLITEEKHYKKGELYSRIANDYEGTRIKESRYYSGSAAKPSKVWQYEYYADGQKKSSRIYYKGKLQSVYNYECKEEGELARPHKDTIQICKNESIDKDGNRTVTTRTFGEDGRPVKSVKVITPKNVVIESRTYNAKDQLTYAYQSNTEQTKLSYTYYTKGKEWFRTEMTRTEKQQLLEEVTYYKKKFSSRETNHFNTDGKITISTYETDRSKRETRYSYDSKNMETAAVTINNKGEVSYASMTMYNFY